MDLEGREVHIDVEHAVNELRHLQTCEILKAGKQQIAHILAKEQRVGLSRRLCRRIEQWYGDLIRLN